jgi:hypothetical protein
MMPFRLSCLLVGAISALSAPARAADSYDTPSAARLIVFGDLSSKAPADTHGDRPLGELVSALQQQLAADHSATAAVEAKARRDAFGPTTASETAGANPVRSYAECMRRNVEELASSPQRYEAVIRAAYPVVIHRDAYPEELAYWKKHGVVPYTLLLAAIENWARRNQPGLMVTAGAPTVSINSAYLTTVRVSPAAAAEVRSLLGRPATAADKAEANRGHLLAAGGDALETDGAMYFVAAGR